MRKAGGTAEDRSFAIGKLQAYQQVLESSLGIPFSNQNAIEVLKNGDEIFPAMLKAIDEAEHTIDFLTFVYWSGDIAVRFAEALSRKAREGIEVRVILDSFGAAFMPDELYQKMDQSGVQIEWFRPFTQWKIWKTDNRTHRKVLICDNKIGFTGGVGIAEEWEGDARNPDEWRETHFRIEGEAVFGLHAAFMENWIETGRPLLVDRDWNSWKTDASSEGAAVQVVRTSASVRWSDIVMLYHTLISMARERIQITTAYFNPHKVIVDLLKKKAREGVKVDIMMPGRHIDKRVAKIAGEDSFQPLLDAGVTLWYYQKTMLHSKIICIDDAVSCIGSANFNHRSMLKDDEINLVVIDPKLSEMLNKHFRMDLGDCDKVEESLWKRRSLFRRSLETVTNLFKQQI
ncbi:phospholipase D-like domain-containing protein [Aliifodinibius sp. S!AR15-10]|uniref:phospholipase D-like domain-containing protein n=1 Tax=Aliifodinibius sp. S!AR15-10 TaxID=2950437 RepID=UPI00285C0F17|nr:phospholipase D-like domain-containing protein [Aliifodinibius sp. S!AR15-10]MDR8389669.1 phospholipase D-like domain-containing protein [Aliifodinibius sp. S!AR15-10]